MALPGNQNDGNMAVMFSEDNLEVRADFFAPRGEGTPISMEAVSTALAQMNVSYGVKWDVLQDAVTRCNLDRSSLKDVLIARGDEPVDEIAEYFERNPSLAPPALQKPKGNDRLDYRSYSPFTIVKQDQALARLHPEKKGADGKDVHGEAIPHGILRPAGVSGGEHTRVEGGYILSAINGQLIENKGIMSVQDFLVIKGAVGYATGNIIFPGDVTIEGPVSDGFKIYSGGSVTIKQTFDVTDVVTRDNLTVAGGIVGRGRALVKVGGSLRTKFIQNCRVACRKGIVVDTEIINSSVYTMDTLKMGEKGIIVGGEVYAIHGLKTGRIGKTAGKSTRIHCGLDFTALQEKEKFNSHLRLLENKLEKLRKLMAVPEPNAEKKTKMEELLLRLEGDHRNTAERIAALLSRINANEDAVVEVSGEIAPGTLIEICQIALFVAEPLNRVRVRLDKSLGKLVADPL